MTFLHQRFQRYCARITVAVLLALCFLHVPALLAQATRPGGPGGREPQPARPVNEEQGRRIIEHFRSQRLAGDFLFHFELVQIPRRGKDIPFEGFMWGTWTAEGPLTRVAVWEPGRRAETMRQFIILSGRNPRAWLTLPDGSVAELDQSQMIEPLLPQLLYTPFDLAMPFVYWDATYIGPDRVRGRRAQVFLMHAPQDVREARPDWDQVQIALDDEFHALLRAQIVDAAHKAQRSFSIRSFKEVGGQYIIRGVDLVDEASRDRTRFEVKGAAVGLQLPPDIFQPASLRGNTLPQMGEVQLEAL